MNGYHQDTRKTFVYTVLIALSIVLQVACSSNTDNKRADNHYNNGLQYAVSGNFELAIVEYDQAIALNPNHAYAYNERGATYYQVHDLYQAISDFSKAIELDSTYTYAYNNRGISYANLGDYDNAIADFSKAIELDPNFDKPYINRASAYFVLGQKSDAIQDLEKVLKITSDPKSRAYAEKALQELKEK